MDPDLYAQALADLRAIPTTPETPSGPAPCCTGDRRGYQWHQRTGNLPACAASRQANNAYMRAYYRHTRHAA